MSPRDPRIRKKAPGPRKAIALRYDVTKDEAPRIMAKGSGALAERILEIAREHKIHVHNDPDLVGLLAKLDPDQHIPEHLYRAVAEVLAVVYRLNRDAANAKS